MPTAENLTGRKFSRLLVVCRDHSAKKRVHWICLCSCGKQVSKSADCLKRGTVMSCGCYALEVRSRPRRTPMDALTSYHKVLANGCWQWTRKIDAGGYGRISVKQNGKMRHALVHRVAYEEFVGPIPDGMDLDHLCHTHDPSCAGGKRCPHRSCINPEHLEPVSKLENVLRGKSFSAINKNKSICSRGHLFTEENTRKTPDGRRRCLICMRANWLAKYYRDKRRKTNEP